MTFPIAAIIKAKLRSEGRFVLTLCGRCMEPLLVEGDRAVVELCDDPQVGDVVLVCLDNGLLAVHRLVAFESGLCVTKGDYSGKVERTSLFHILGVVRKFSLDGGAWIEDPRSRDELIGLANLSLTIGCTIVGAANDDARYLIWNQNKFTRMAMMRESEYMYRKT